MARRFSILTMLTLRQKTRLNGRVMPMRTREARVKMIVHTPGLWGEAEMIRTMISINIFLKS